MTILIKGTRFPRHIILHAVLLYLRYGMSHRDLEKIIPNVVSGPITALSKDG